MKVKVAVVQSESVWGDEEYRNAERCIRYLEEAARTGAQLIAFPEGYPGPAHGPLHSGKLPLSPIEMTARKARELGVYVAASNVEENPKIPGTYFLCQKLISPEGEIIADHRRTHPDEPDLNEYLFNGKRDFAPGDDVTVVDTELGKIGLLICSEIWVPELPRMEMLMGAEIIISPRNGAHKRGQTNTNEAWYAICRARAAENMLYVLVTQNIFMKGGKGIANITGPEGVLAQTTQPGIITAELDMDRLRRLRESTFSWEFINGNLPPDITPPVLCRPGQHVLRRPEMYRRLAEPLPSDFDYWYFLKEKTKPASGK